MQSWKEKVLQKMNTIDFSRLVQLPVIDRARELAFIAHGGQVDKAGEDYINHPVRVSNKCNTEEQKVVALLHDVIEDTDITKDDLSKLGFSSKIIEAVLSVTKLPGEDYRKFIDRCKLNPIGKVVKLHDLEDNLDITRLRCVAESDLDRINKYLEARRILMQ